MVNSPTKNSLILIRNKRLIQGLNGYIVFDMTAECATLTTVVEPHPLKKFIISLQKTRLLPKENIMEMIGSGLCF